MTNALATREAREQHPLVVGIQQRMAAPAFAKMLPAGMDFDRFAAVTVQAIIKNPDILGCSPESVIAAVVEAAQDGLEPTGARGGAHLVKFGNEAVLIRDYRGIIRIIIESGAATRVDARAVHRGDEFALDYASPDPVTHRPSIPPTGDVIGYYALFWLPDGTKQAEFMTVDDIQKVRSKSRGKDSMGWTDFFDQMARKTVIKRGANYLNLRPDIRERLMREDQAEYEGQVVSVQRDERLAATRSRLHSRAARLTGGDVHPEQPPAGSVEASAPPTASCPHPALKHEATELGVVCSDCGALLAHRDQPAAAAGEGAAAVARGGDGSSGLPAPIDASAVASSPPGDGSPASDEVDGHAGEAGYPQPATSQSKDSTRPSPATSPATTMADAQTRVGNLAVAHRLVSSIQNDEDWARFDDVMRMHGVEQLPLEATSEAIAEWNALADRIAAGEFDPADDPAGRCQAHGQPWKWVPPGTNRTTGKPFNGFFACEVRDCKARPTDAWRRANRPADWKAE